jgi:hypothetical protein
MHALRHAKARLKLLLILALCLRALVPDGYMPGQGKLLELCTLDGMRTVLVDPQTGDLLDHDPNDDAPACPWAAVFASAVLTEWGHATPFLPTASPKRPTHPQVWPSPALTIPPARAPPLSSHFQSA